MLKLIIVDDEPKIRRGLKKWIEEFDLNYEVVGEAANYIEALDIAKKENPDVFLMDINMPTMNGLDLTSKLQSKYPNSHTIIISGYDDFEYAHQALKLKVFDYLLKPIPRTDLYNVLKSLSLEILSRKEGAMEDKSIYKDRNNIGGAGEELSAIVTIVKDYIEENYSSVDLSLQKTANLFNVNKTYLSRLMKEQLGHSFTEYTTKIRLEKAKELLKDHILYSHIYEISNKVGFRSQHYFSRVFRKSQGISPMEYRNKYFKQ